MSNSSNSFVVDAPNALIVSGTSYNQILTAKSGKITVKGESIKINGGWSPFELADIDTKQSVDIELTDAEFKMSTTALNLGSEVKKGAAEKYIFGETYTTASNKITIPYAVVPGSVKIEGFTETTGTVATTQFKVVISDKTTEISFFTDVTDGTEISPVFRISVENTESISVDDKSIPKSGTFVLEYPAYGKDDDGNDLLIGTIQWLVYKAKISKETSMGGSYKSASEFSLKASALDPRRPDHKVFDVLFFPKAA